MTTAMHGLRLFRRSTHRYLLMRRRNLSSNNVEGTKETQKATIKSENGANDTVAETKPLPLATEPPLLNPFPLLAHATENIDLTSCLRSYSNTFGIIGALMCTLSMQALSFNPMEDNDLPKVHDTDQDTMTRKRTPILVKYLRIPEKYLQDMYIASWAVSFFSSAIGLGLHCGCHGTGLCQDFCEASFGRFDCTPHSSSCIWGICHVGTHNWSGRSERRTRLLDWLYWFGGW